MCDKSNFVPMLLYPRVPRCRTMPRSFHTCAGMRNPSILFSHGQDLTESLPIGNDVRFLQVLVLKSSVHYGQAHPYLEVRFTIF